MKTLITITAICVSALPVLAADTTKIVTSTNMAGWLFYDDVLDTPNNSLGSFVPGPGNPPLGFGSAQINVAGPARVNLATYQFAGVKLADITTLKFTTYNPLAGNGEGPGSQRSGYLNFNVDFNGSDTWQRRLVYVPRQNGVVLQNTWQEWDAISGGTALWGYSGNNWPVTGEPGTTLKTWSQILTQYPGVRIRVTDSFLGIRVGEPYNSGYTENIDSFKFGTSNGTTIFNFEDVDRTPKSKDACKDGGWQSVYRADYSVFKNQGDCIQYVNTGK